MRSRIAWATFTGLLFVVQASRAITTHAAGSSGTPDCVLRLDGQPGDAGFGSAVAFPGDLNTDGFADMVVGAGSYASGAGPGRAYVFFGGPAADTTPDVALQGQGIGDRFGYAVAAAGDANSDGHPDLLVGAYQNDALGSNTGRAYVFFGGPGFDATPDLVLTGTNAGDEFGIAVAGVGDVNADGHDDLLVGARFNAAGGFQAGRAYVYFGGPSADATPDLMVTGNAGDRLGFTVAAFEDVNGDGRAEFLVGAYHASSSMGSQSGRLDVCFPTAGGGLSRQAIFGDPQDGAHFSDGLAAGDVNGDGRADVLVGASQRDGATGRVWIYFGGPAFDAVADLVLTSGSSGGWLGRALAGGADLDGDGFGDLVVGSPALSNGAPGSALFYRGGSILDAVPDDQLSGETGGEAYGWSVGASKGQDTNSDGRDDLCVGALFGRVGDDPRGRATLGFGPCIVIDCPSDSTAADLSAGGLPGDVGFGISTALTGDLDGDGFDDFAVATTTFDPPGDLIPGSVGIFFGGPGGDASADVVVSGQSAGDRFGYAIAGAGDLNGDGHSDLAVGAYRDDFGGEDTGRVYVYFGGRGFDAAPDVVYSGLAAGEQFGIALAGVGDVNGDSFDDLLVGARFNSSGGPEAGRAYVYFGSPSPSLSPGLILKNQWAGERFGFTVARGGDLNGDHQPDLLVGAYHNGADGQETGRAYVYFGGPGVIDDGADLVLRGAGDRAHFSDGLGAADVNGDGHSDILVGASQLNAATGRAWIYFGGAGLDDVADLTLDDGLVGDWYGRIIGGAADLDGDGYDDWIVGAPSPRSGRSGRVHVYRGGPNCDAVCDAVFWGASADDQFGWSAVSSKSNVNADGAQDLLIGSPTGNPPAGVPGSGRADFFSRQASLVGPNHLPPRPKGMGLDAVFETAIGARILYSIGSQDAPASIDIHDIAGRRVRRFEVDVRTAGSHALLWDGCDARGTQVARGVYLVRLQAGGRTATRKLVIVRP